MQGIGQFVQKGLAIASQVTAQSGAPPEVSQGLAQGAAALGSLGGAGGGQQA